MGMICLCLMGSTLEENLAAVDRYRGRIDMAELRVDSLNPDERFRVRRFPELARIPVILTVRRKVDGGRFEDGEGVRLVILAKGLAYASTDRSRNFAYIDLENDLRVPALEEAARTFGTRVIRSMHAVDGVPEDLAKVWRELTVDPYEIPKLACAPRNTVEAAAFLRFFKSMPSGDRIASAMGDVGFFSRVLTAETGSMLSYSFALGAGLEPGASGQVDPDELEGVYGYRELDGSERVYGIVGNPVFGSHSPVLHNAAFKKLGIKSVYLPFKSETLDDFFVLADELDIAGCSITVPFKEKIMPYLASVSVDAKAIGACNTIMRTKEGWNGFNTDADGFEKAALSFMNRKSLHGVKAAIIGAGGAAKAIAYALDRLGAKACIISRGMTRAKHLADRYGLEWSAMDEQAVRLLDRYRDLIVQATPVGMEGGPVGDPLEWYEFTGKETIFETIYKPSETPLLKRARAAGCKTINGYEMLVRQGADQFEIFTGLSYPGPGT